MAALAIMVISAATLAGAWFFQLVLEILPCPLCLEQRYAYYFAVPFAAMLALGESPPGQPRGDGSDRRGDWPDDLGEIVYVDHFGNAMTGLRTATLPPNTRLAAAGRRLERERTFSDRQPGAAFWYENSNGLAEIAVNQGRADRDLGLAIGSPVEIVS